MAVLPESMAEFEEYPRYRKQCQRQKSKHTSSPMDAQILIHLNGEQREYRSEKVSKRSICSDSCWSESQIIHLKQKEGGLPDAAAPAPYDSIR